MNPHYLRFARALALLSTAGLATNGCAESVHPFFDAAVRDAPAGDTVAVRDAAVTDAAVTDAVTPPDADPCASCSCGFGGGDMDQPLCMGELEIRCCAAVGPLPPPELV